MKIEAWASAYYANIRNICTHNTTGCQKALTLLQIITFPVVVIPLELCRLVARVTKCCCCRQKEKIAKVSNATLTHKASAKRIVSDIPRNCPFEAGEAEVSKPTGIRFCADIFTSNADALVCPINPNSGEQTINEQFNQQIEAFRKQGDECYRDSFEQLLKDHSDNYPLGIATSIESVDLVKNKSRYVIVVAISPQEERDALYSAYYNALKVASDLNLQSIAFPRLTGSMKVYYFNDAIKIALRAICDFQQANHNTSIKEILMCEDESYYKVMMNPK